MIRNSSAVSTSTDRARGTSVPSRLRSRASRRRIVGGVGPGPPMSTVPGSSVAPHSSTISWAARAWASIACSGAMPFSNRAEASLRSPRSSPVRWMFAPFQVAASISTRVVSADTSERAPPITPATDVGPSASSISTVPALTVRVWPSSVSTGSGAAASRTVSREPLTRSRSKACSG